ncbi:uncharacterized protein C8R40DRAFT_1171639 [Lentinula edodes]|uniref:uncharacterized protein n=1 Tax=Lentinula edodes TaxID=5353 RepID=UPI001E8EC5B7|nr:uncharacterized protein C8R40DRAFT_1171639 [Lentinula edodes]KAH7874146.1 hypothetical protein C8R40DRAFT_1171639 [Lentinula edodes]
MRTFTYSTGSSVNNALVELEGPTVLNEEKPQRRNPYPSTHSAPMAQHHPDIEEILCRSYFFPFPLQGGSSSSDLSSSSYSFNFSHPERIYHTGSAFTSSNLSHDTRPTTSISWQEIIENNHLSRLAHHNFAQPFRNTHSHSHSRDHRIL